MAADHKKLVLLIVTAFSAIFLSIPKPVFASSGCKFPAIFNFGDSNSDTGGLSAAFGPAPPPNGESFFPRPAGRYSDGRLIIDFIARVFKELLPKQEYFSRALYTFDIGQNDLTAGLFLNMSVEEVKAYIPDVLNKFSIVVKIVYGQGGRAFWIHNTGPFGCLPYVLDRLPITGGQLDRVGCANPFNEIAQLFNKQLKETVVQLRKDLPLATLTYVDVYAVKYDLIARAKKHGFVHPLRACCGHGGKYNYNKNVGCGGKIVVNGSEVLIGKSCIDPSVRVNWDGVHYTQAANKWVFNQIVDGSFSDPPTPLRMACKPH